MVNRFERNMSKRPLLQREETEIGIPPHVIKGHLTFPQFVAPFLPPREDGMPACLPDRPFKRSSGSSCPRYPLSRSTDCLRHFLLLSRLRRIGGGSAGDLETFQKLNCRHFIVPFRSSSRSQPPLLTPAPPLSSPNRRQTNFARSLNQQPFQNRCLLLRC